MGHMCASLASLYHLTLYSARGPELEWNPRLCPG